MPGLLKRLQILHEPLEGQSMAQEFAFSVNVTFDGVSEATSGSFELV